MNLDLSLDAPVICVRCGLPAGEVDLAGCTRDTESEHQYLPLAARPFRDWTEADIVARMERASVKGTSAAATAEHFRTCPEAGPGTYVHRLYVQKARKRLGLARALAMELWTRAGGTTLLREPDRRDTEGWLPRQPLEDELSADECERLGLDPTGRDGDPRWPFRYSNLTAYERRKLDHYRKSATFKLD